MKSHDQKRAGRCFRGPLALRTVTAIAAVLALMALAAAPARATTVTVSSTDLPKSIPNASFTGVSSTLTAPALILSDVNLVLNVDHSSVADLHIELTSPEGTTITLVKAFTESGILLHKLTPDNFVNTVFDDAAPTNLSDGTAPYTGSFNVNHTSVGTNPLSGFDGQNSFGTWTLFISDLAAQDSGSLLSWSLQLTGDPTSPPEVVPEPATIFLLGGGLVALIYTGRRRHRGKAGPTA